MRKAYKILAVVKDPSFKVYTQRDMVRTFLYYRLNVFNITIREVSRGQIAYITFYNLKWWAFLKAWRIKRAIKLIEAKNNTGYKLFFEIKLQLPHVK